MHRFTSNDFLNTCLELAVGGGTCFLGSKCTQRGVRDLFMNALGSASHCALDPVLEGHGLITSLHF